MSRGFGNAVRYQRQAATALRTSAQLQAISSSGAASREAARVNSYSDPTNVLTASDAGADASIAVAAHDRVYPVLNGIVLPNVAILAGSITGLAFATEYSVYYDDITLAETAPTFAATTDRATAQTGAAAGRHYLGLITTPADGAGGTSGSGGFPPGGGGGGELT